MRSDHIQRHMNVCPKNGGLGVDKVQIQQHSLTEKKSVNPKISALTDTDDDDDDIDDLPPPPKQDADLTAMNVDGR